jgi:hypothetical protein
VLVLGAPVAGEEEGDTATMGELRLFLSIDPLGVRGPRRRAGDWSLRGELKENEVREISPFSLFSTLFLLSSFSLLSFLSVCLCLCLSSLLSPISLHSLSVSFPLSVSLSLFSLLTQNGPAAQSE